MAFSTLRKRRARKTSPLTTATLPLKGVCESQARFGTGIVIFAAITVLCLGGVIFGTSSASLSEIRAELNCCACWRRWRDAPVEEVGGAGRNARHPGPDLLHDVLHDRLHDLLHDATTLAWPAHAQP